MNSPAMLLVAYASSIISGSASEAVLTILFAHPGRNIASFPAVMDRLRLKNLVCVGDIINTIGREGSAK